MMTNKEIIFNKKDYKSYKDFYEDVVIKLKGYEIIDFADDKNLGYMASILDEFMWYNHDKNLNMVFLGFDLEKIKKQKTHEDYRWSLIFKVLLRFVEEYPNNTLEFRDE